MKHHLKNYLKLGILLFGISFLLVSCQHDDDIKNFEQKRSLSPFPFKISKINSEDIQKKGHLTYENSKSKSIKDKYRADNFKLYTSSYEFQIDTDYVTYIETSDNSYHSYTFPIINKAEKDSLDNLLISLQPDGTYSAFIVKYATTSQEKEDIKNGISIDLSDRVIYESIEDAVFITSILNDKGLNTEISNKSIYDTDCIEYDTTITPCLGGFWHEHSTTYNEEIGGQCGGSGFDIVGANVNWDCLDNSTSTGDGQNSSTTGTTGTGNNNTGGTPNNNENPDLTSPTPCVDCPEFQDPPCPGDPVPNPEIAPQLNSGIKGALYGCTRYGDDGCQGEDDRNEEHNGIDIKSKYGSPLYAMLDGVVHSKYEQKGKAGYVIRIKSELPNGEIVIYQYFHMQKEGRPAVGTSVVAGTTIVGYQGDSGNLKGAIEKGTVESHVHIKMNIYDGSGDSNDYSTNFKNNPINPADYMHTQIDDLGNSTTGDCN